jgi:hypothetical protein
VIIENRYGLVVAACAMQASATAERTAGLARLDPMGLRADRAPVPDKQFTLARWAIRACQSTASWMGGPDWQEKRLSALPA